MSLSEEIEFFDQALVDGETVSAYVITRDNVAKFIKDKRISPEELHKWYLEATKKLNPASFNKDAQKPYKELTEEQKFIDKFIADKINEKSDKEAGPKLARTKQ